MECGEGTIEMFVCTAWGSWGRRGLENASISLQCIDHIRVGPVTTFLINLRMSSLNVMFHRSGQQNYHNTMPTTYESRQLQQQCMCKNVPCGLAVAYI